MANELTGDFDVVVQFAVSAVNRILAGMHQLERFPHSISARVEDNHQPGVAPDRPSLVGLVDVSGEAVSNQQRIGRPLPISGASATSTSAALLDAVVNVNIAGVEIEPIEPSHFQGRVQLQLFPPTIQIADSSATRIAIALQMLVRYFPDPGTNRAAEFIRGELQLTAAVNQVASQAGNVLEIGIKQQNVGVRFTPHWSSSPLTAEDIAGIELFIRNSLKTSFLPSNSTLPSSIKKVQFKTFSGGGGAVAMLLNLNEGSGNPGSTNALLLGGSDQFAFGVSADFVKAAFQPTLDDILSRPVDPVKFDIHGYIHTWHITYTVTLKDASLDFESAWMVLTITGHAHTGRSWLPDFDFTVRQKLGLAPFGATVNLTLGDISLDTSSTIADLFKGPALDSIRKVRDGSLAESGAQGTVADMLDAYAQLGGVLDSLLKPPRKGFYQPRGYDLAYTSAEIRSSGIVLHGSLSLGTWYAPHVEYEQIPVDHSSHHPGFGPGAAGLFDGPDYSALRSWIPGGTIQRFEWKHYGETQPGFMDANRFVYFSPPPQVETEPSSGSGPAGTGPHGIHVTDVEVATLGGLDHSTVCLTLHGTRLSPGGVVGALPVTATICGYRSFPIPGDVFGDEDTPVIALARRGGGGNVEVTGHADAIADRTGSGAPNLVVHFADGARADAATILSQAVKQAKRDDAPTAVVIVASGDRLARMRYAPGITYASDDNGAWARRFGVNASRGPVTLVVGPAGKILSKQEGEIDGARLTEALKKTLVARTPVRPSLLRTGTRIGESAPNFIFEYAPGNQMTFSKLAGRPAILFFLKPSSSPIVESLRELRSMAQGKNGDKPMVFAIVDGKTNRDAKSSPDIGDSVTIVPDPERKIASAYGVTVWPTTLLVDSRGIVTGASSMNDAGSKR